MRLIAHRGNVWGPDEKRENTLPYLQEALALGYDVETDVWLRGDGIYLGHNKPLSRVPTEFLRDSRVWSHCKDVETFNHLITYPDVNCFVQDRDSVSVTSRGFLWYHAATPMRFCTGNKAIVGWPFVPHSKEERFEVPMICHAVYSDYVGNFESTEDISQKPFDLLVVDIDGVMTDGKSYNRDGTVAGKYFCDLDFTAIKRFKASGIEVCFLSGDTIVNEAMAATRKIRFFHNTPGRDKVDMLPAVEEAMLVGRGRMAYVGDDVYDVGVMSQVKYSFCPASSPALVKRVATRVLDVQAGKGVLAALYDACEEVLPQVYPVDSPDVNPK